MCHATLDLVTITPAEFAQRLSAAVPSSDALKVHLATWQFDDYDRESIGLMNIGPILNLYRTSAQNHQIRFDVSDEQLAAISGADVEARRDYVRELRVLAQWLEHYKSMPA